MTGRGRGLVGRHGRRGHRLNHDVVDAHLSGRLTDLELKLRRRISAQVQIGVIELLLRSRDRDGLDEVIRIRRVPEPALELDRPRRVGQDLEADVVILIRHQRDAAVPNDDVPDVLAAHRHGAAELTGRGIDRERDVRGVFGRFRSVTPPRRARAVVERAVRDQVPSRGRRAARASARAQARGPAARRCASGTATRCTATRCTAAAALSTAAATSARSAAGARAARARPGTAAGATRPTVRAGRSRTETEGEERRKRCESKCGRRSDHWTPFGWARRAGLFRQC